MAFGRGAPWLWLTGSVAMVACAQILDAPSFSSAGTRADAGALRDGEADHDGRDADAAPTTPASGAIMVSGSFGLQNWCLVTEGGDVECWGQNVVGELGNGTTVAAPEPVKVKGLPGAASMVSVGATFACALTRAGAVWCWGDNTDGALGNGKTGGPSRVPVPVTGLQTDVVSISSSEANCALKKDGSVWCWGLGEDEVLGNGGTASSDVPVPVTGLTSGVTQIASGNGTSCAVRASAVFCWGATLRNGELGNGTNTGSAVPVPVKKLASGVVEVSVGGTFACAVIKTGAVACWGNGDDGQLGDGQLASSSTPVAVQGLSGPVSSVSAGYDFACALEEDGSVECWGFGGDGELGSGRKKFADAVQASSPTPVKVLGLSSPATYVSGGTAPCAVLTGGGVECWGITAETTLVPLPTTGPMTGVTTVSIGGALSSTVFACALAGHNASCWGGNGFGQLGNETTTDSTTPISAGTFNATSAIVAAGAGDFACAIDSKRGYCWGDNAMGQLGNGSTISSNIPVAVEGLDNLTAIAAGAGFACALTTTGAVWCWGDNTYGQLGNGSGVSSHVPKAVPTLTNGVTALSASADYACVILTNKTVECWGNDTSGELGNGSKTTSPTPMPVVGLTGADTISTGWYSACAITQGTVWCWGYNGTGELGNGGTTSSAVPVAISEPPGMATIVAVGTSAACGVFDGKAYCWGLSPLGDGEVTPSLTPSAVRNLSSGVTALAVGLGTACAVVDGSVSCWGVNTAGQLGNGGATDSFVPIPITLPR